MPVIGLTVILLMFIGGFASVSISDGSREVGKDTGDLTAFSVRYPQDKPSTAAHSCPKQAGEASMGFLNCSS